MMRIRFDLESAVGPERSRSLGTMEIELIGGAESTVMKTKGRQGDYRYRIRKWTKDKGVWKSGTVSGHHRCNRGPWDLLFLCLRDAVAKRNPPGE